MDNRQSAAIARFRTLHESGCFVIPNPWDVGSAVYLRHLGFKALATTSAGFAFTRAMPDAAIPIDLVLGHVREIAEATDLPVNADFQDGYAIEPEGVAANVSLCIGTGAAGLSIEDSTGDPSKPLYDEKLAIERVKAARQTIDASGIPVILTARCEAWLVGHKDAQAIARDRLAAFADAGADCLYAPSVRTIGEIAALVKIVAPKPVNALVSAPGPDWTVSKLADAGVRRISVGSAFARAAWGGFIRAAKSISETGSFEALGDAAPFAELNGIFGKSTDQ